MQLNYKNDFEKLSRRIDKLIDVIEGKPDTSITMDERGFRARQVQMIWKEERNRRL